MSVFGGLTNRYLDRRARRATDRVLTLLEVFPDLRQWPRADLLALAAMTLGTSPVVAKMARDQLRTNDREALA